MPENNLFVLYWNRQITTKDNYNKNAYMRNALMILVALLVFMQANAQKKWFTTYSDAASMVADANLIIRQMADRIVKINPITILNNNSAVKNTQPQLIFIDGITINLPFWEEVIPPQKQFFTEVAGGENEGKEAFGLFFNGFYLAHELGHAFFGKSGVKFENDYDSEYEANKFSILYWTEADESDNLKSCYNYAKKMLKNLKNPVPENEDFKKYLTEHYEELSRDPYKYGYIHFSQFVEIYENKQLTNFDTYIKSYQTGK